MVGRLLRRSVDLDDVAVDKLCFQRHPTPVDPSAYTLVANLRVNPIRKVQRRGAACFQIPAHVLAGEPVFESAVRADPMTC